MRFYSIPAYIYSSLTIRISRRPTVIDKCRFQVRLFPASTYCAHALRLLPLSDFFSRPPPLCSVRF